MLSSLPLSSSSEDVLDEELELLIWRWWEGTYMYMYMKREREEGEERRKRKSERESKAKLIKTEIKKTAKN